MQAWNMFLARMRAHWKGALSQSVSRKESAMLKLPFTKTSFHPSENSSGVEIAMDLQRYRV